MAAAGGGGREELIEAHGYDTRYAMHCARLGFQCLELLETRHLDLPIQGEPAEWLRAVRHGDVPVEEWWTRSLDLDRQLEAGQENGRLPAGPDRQRISDWMVATHQRVWAASPEAGS